MLLKQLEAFHAVVRHGGFDHASAALRLSQPAISLRIKELERHLGVKLFIRLGRRDQLTEAGRIVAEYASRVMIVLREMNETLGDLKGLRQGQLRCGAARTIAVHILPSVLVRFKQTFPDLDVRLLAGRTVETEKRILSDELDIGIVTGALTNPGNLRIFHFLTDELVFISPPHHPRAKSRALSLKEIENVPLILREKGSLTRALVEEAFRSAGVSCHCVMEIEATEGLKAAVAQGLGCSFVPRCSIQTEMKTGVLACRRIAGAPMRREFRVIVHKDKSLAGPIRPFLDALKIKVAGPLGDRRNPNGA